ncbi:hypothetical protein RHGRI_037749 [Rhododendron griersonianum]|uniref:Exonuclease 1 n=1 Tax=Rhododendron griersonianum TaxID=479676 RepID=A0AAV6HT95_9ERIC|nr:hypothetical protein RHGRI_037749 [Rhododendron griersonianum]
MGIQGLLPLLKSIMVPTHIKDLEGCSVAVDTYSWLHKGALSCSKDLCKGQPTSKHIDYCMHRVNLLRHYGVRPILVFDGGLLPMKSEQEIKRARARKENLARAIEHETNGNNSAAYDCYQKAVDISPSVAYELIQVLKQQNVHYVVAPYEADAQMTFLAVSKQVDAVITEDSDLIAFGCPRIIYKMDKFGQGVEFRYSKLQQNKELNFTGFTKQMLLEMCILSGCDYLLSLPGMGLKKAHALMKKFGSYDKVIKHLKYSTVAVPPSYEDSFRKAMMTFQHQRVYDPMVEDIAHLSDLPDDVGDDLDFLAMPQHIAIGIAKGDLDPFTKMPFEGVNNDGAGLVVDGTSKQKVFKPEGQVLRLKDLSIPVSHFEKMPVAKRVEAQKVPISTYTLYYCTKCVMDGAFSCNVDKTYSNESFASLEAKRRFTVPRSNSKHPNPPNENSSTAEQVTEEAAACETGCSPTSLFDDFRYLGNATPPEGYVNSSDGTKSPERCESPSHGLHGKEDTLVDNRRPQDPLLQQSRHSVHKPCSTLHKDHHRKPVSDAGEGKTRKENIMRSSYFQYKVTKGDDEENDKEDVLSDDCEDMTPEHECKSASDAGNAKTRAENRKTITRSPYFLQKPVNENNNDKGHDKIVKDDLVARTCDYAIHESASSGYFNSSSMKRKVVPVGSAQMESTNSRIIFTPEDTITETEASGGKFGCNISHLENYSDIADKSIERFVSVISSFRCSSSGSRASGLRAPLKDVRNTCTIRSNSAVDFGDFAYVPTKRKTSVHRQG